MHWSMGWSGIGLFDGMRVVIHRSMGCHASVNGLLDASVGVSVDVSVDVLYPCSDCVVCNQFLPSIVVSLFVDGYKYKDRPDITLYVSL